MNRMLGLTIACVLVVAGSLGLPSSALAEPVSITVENTSASDRPAGPVTFGMVFAKGDARGVREVKDLPTQFDVKRHWPDGSIKHAVVTVALPTPPPVPPPAGPPPDTHHAAPGTPWTR